LSSFEKGAGCVYNGLVQKPDSVHSHDVALERIGSLVTLDLIISALVRAYIPSTISIFIPY
jgi:hypothetical protein